jgi:hypothetical protein
MRKASGTLNSISCTYDEAVSSSLYITNTTWTYSNGYNALLVEIKTRVSGEGQSAGLLFADRTHTDCLKCAGQVGDGCNASGRRGWSRREVLGDAAGHHSYGAEDLLSRSLSETKRSVGKGHDEDTRRWCKGKAGRLLIEA